ncbi:MAG: hypothetical protein QM687_09995 [Ferruginibacter sp.]
MKSKRKTLFSAAVLCMALLLSQGCKKNNDDDSASSAYPKTVNIQYKVSSPAGFTQAMQIQYTNETGGINSATNITLPYSTSFNKTVNRYDVQVLMFAATGVGELKGEILVDGAVVASKTFTGSSASSTIPGQVTYTFP